MEPQNFGGQPPAFRPKNWLIESILVTLFCCLPLGIVGIINAAQVNSRYNAGDYMGAQSASKEAGKWVKIAFFVGIALGIIGIIFNVILGVGAGIFGAFD